MRSVRRIIFPLLSVVCAGGCGSYTQVQMRLVDQAHKGLVHVAGAQEAQVALTEQLAEMRRRRLDEAFDADVRERDLAGLTPEWVIAHRQAYAAALDALEKQRGASRESSQTTQRNLEAVEAALERLRWLQSIQLKWVTLNGEISHERD